MIKQEIVKRWKTEEGMAVIKRTIEYLTTGKPLSMIAGLEKHSGRWDLRGAQLSTLENEKRIESGGHGVTQKFGTLKLKNAKIESVDFSYADISYSSWERCSVSNCLFEETKAREIRSYATDFLMCVFRKANLHYSYIENIGANSGSFKQVEFIETNLSECLFSFPTIEDCSFLDCNLVETIFDGSRFKDCKFKGDTDSAWFRGYSKNAQKSILGLFHRVNPKSYPNRMENVDFSNAELKSNCFSDEIDLSRCIFPKDDSKYILVRNLKEVYEQAKQLINKEWNGEDKRKAVSFIDNLFYRPDHQNQPMDLIDKNLLTDEGKDQEFGEKFFNLIREINSKVA